MSSTECPPSPLIALYIADRSVPKEEVTSITDSVSLLFHPDHKHNTADGQPNLQLGKYAIDVQAISRENGEILQQLSLKLQKTQKELQGASTSSISALRIPTETAHVRATQATTRQSDQRLYQKLVEKRSPLDANMRDETSCDDEDHSVHIEMNSQSVCKATMDALQSAPLPNRRGRPKGSRNNIKKSMDEGTRKQDNFDCKTMAFTRKRLRSQIESGNESDIVNKTSRGSRLRSTSSSTSPASRQHGQEKTSHISQKDHESDKQSLYRRTDEDSRPNKRQKSSQSRGSSKTNKSTT